MEIEDHYNQFKEIVQKYGLDHEKTAEQISHFLTKSDRSSVSAHEFSTLFGMDDEEAILFLSFIDKGLRFKEQNMDQGQNKNG